jgi:tRNA pseudouridine55 synthase
MTMDGVLVVDKPAGPTSHDVVARVRRTLGERRVGHTGTLDPLATGVLPLVVGRATRLARFLMPARKEYTAEIRLGVSTDTYDATGRPDQSDRDTTSPPLPAADRIESALTAFRGTYLQTPPPFSAKKIAGERAHRLARRRQAVAPGPVPVTVERLDLLDVEEDRIRLAVICSSGFYVRSLAHDLGQSLGCGAHLVTLRRTRSGEFDLEQAVPLEEVERQGRGASALIVPLERMVTWLPGLRLTAHGVRRAVHGSPLTASDLADASPEGVPRRGEGDEPVSRVRLFDERGSLVAIAEARAGFLHPVVVLG